MNGLHLILAQGLEAILLIFKGENQKNHSMSKMTKTLHRAVHVHLCLFVFLYLALVEEIKPKSLQSSGELCSCPEHITLGNGYLQDIKVKLGIKWQARRLRFYCLIHLKRLDESQVKTRFLQRELLCIL